MPPRNRRGRALPTTPPRAPSWWPRRRGRLPAGWVQVLNVQDIDWQKNVIEGFDDGDLEDPDEVPRQIVKPGKMSFTKKKNSDATSQSVTLQGMCDGTTLNAWAFVYPDGTVVQTANGRLVSSSGGKASNGDLLAKAMESYEVQPTGQLTVTEHA